MTNTSLLFLQRDSPKISTRIGQPKLKLFGNPCAYTVFYWNCPHTLFKALANADDARVPSFTWIPESGTEEGVPHLQIHFNDGKPDDIALLKRYNPIPRAADEREEDIDKCIFNGHLQGPML